MTLDEAIAAVRRFWCASAQIRPCVAAFGDGMTREAALDDLRAARDLLLSVIGPCS